MFALTRRARQRLLASRSADGAAIRSRPSGRPPFHPSRVHVLTPFVERLAMEEQKARVPEPTVLNRTPGELQRRFRKDHRERSSRS